MNNKRMPEQKTWHIIRLAGRTKKSVLHNLFPAATEFGQLIEKADLWQVVYIYELFISDTAWLFKVAGIWNIFVL